MISLSELIADDPSLKPTNQYELEIIHMLSSDQKMFRLYKDPELVEKIKKVVPITELTNKCAQRMISIQGANDTRSNATFEKEVSQQQLESRDVFFLLLLEWFKNDFFKWFDRGYCEKCQKQMKLSGRSPPTQEETLWDAVNVEVYSCDNCLYTERFPRYNHPLKLLETRKGRCGEWRNCFSAICVAFNYEVRLVHDYQDHVWNEVYFESQKRWIHCDCCENAFDTPLMYEVGWGKKLIYCIGTSEYEHQDITLRYIRDYNALLERRKGRCRPEWLNRYLLYASSRLQRNCDSALNIKLLDRRLAELSTLIFIPGVEKHLKEGEKQGRSSGSIDWRVARGECSTSQIKSRNYVIAFVEPTNDGKHRFSYQSAANEYILDDIKLIGWESAVFHSENIFKKVEKDWKMTYLCRLENSDCSKKGTLVYKFDVRFEWSLVTIKVDSKVYDTGEISILLTSEPESLERKLLPNNENTVKKSDLEKDIDHIIMTIILSGGSGDIGWQQSQLFRRSIVEDSTDHPLDVVFC